MERRASKRTRCRLGCELWTGGKQMAATVVDVSRGGLGIHVTQNIEQGESLRVRLGSELGKTVEVEALVWHVRRARRRGETESSFVVGCVLCEPSDEYFELSDALASGGRKSATPPAAAGRPGARAAGAAPEVHAEEPRPQRTFRVRALAAGNRTRLLCVDAASLEEARSRAAAALGEGWKLLETREEPRRG